MVIALIGFIYLFVCLCLFFRMYLKHIYSTEMGEQDLLPGDGLRSGVPMRSGLGVLKEVLEDFLEEKSSELSLKGLAQPLWASVPTLIE